MRNFSPGLAGRTAPPASATRKPGTHRESLPEAERSRAGSAHPTWAVGAAKLHSRWAPSGSPPPLGHHNFRQLLALPRRVPAGKFRMRNFSPGLAGRTAHRPPQLENQGPTGNRSRKCRAVPGGISAPAWAVGAAKLHIEWCLPVPPRHHNFSQSLALALMCPAGKFRMRNFSSDLVGQRTGGEDGT